MLTRLTIVTALASVLVYKPVLADAYDKYRIQCNSNELKMLHAAVANAEELAKKASSVLPPIESNGGSRFRRWFGGPEGDYDETVKMIYDEMRVHLLFQRFWCLPPNSDTPESLFHTNAFILRDSVGEIFVTSRFFLLPITGPGSQGGTIVHEAAHQSAIRKIIDDDISGDGKDDYGPDAAKRRAELSAVRARANADNFKYFAEDLQYGIP